MSSASIARGVAVAAAGGIVALWLNMAVRTPTPPGAPAGSVPDEAVPAVLLGVAIFTALAVTAAAAVLRRAPVVVILSGAISLLPVGLFTLLLPWPHRLIGVLDMVVVAAGIVLLRSGEDDAARSAERGGRPGARSPTG